MMRKAATIIQPMKSIDRRQRELRETECHPTRNPNACYEQSTVTVTVSVSIHRPCALRAHHRHALRLSLVGPECPNIDGGPRPHWRRLQRSPDVLAGFRGKTSGKEMEGSGDGKGKRKREERE